MDTKIYGNITVKKDKDSVIFTDWMGYFVIPRKTWRAILADNVKSVMKPNDEPGRTISQILDNGTPWEEV